MFSIYNILTIAKFETKTLFRSWFFRVFAILTVGVLGFMNVVFFTDAIEILPWTMRAIPGSIAYFNMMMYNIAQAIIAIFMASDFLKRDYKLNTTEVIYMRCMTNGDYVLGKLIGILSVFISLNLLIYLIAAVINIVFSDVPFYFAPYLHYFLVMSIPSLIFIIGLAFISMILVRNQALTFILLLAYVAITLFFLGGKANYLLDYMNWYQPLAFSDFVGFGNIGGVVLHRLMYLCLGFSFIFVTVFSIRRLPQSPLLTRLSVFLAVGLFLVGIFLGINHYGNFRDSRESRSKMIALNDEFADAPLITITSENLKTSHIGKKLQVSAEISLRNDNEEAVDQIILSLNPGLKVSSLTEDGSAVPFQQNMHLLIVDKKIEPGQLATLEMDYSGVVSSLCAYLDVDEELFGEINNFQLYKLQKEFAFVQPKYVLLTPEVLWYPQAGVTAGSTIKPKWKKDFINFTLEVKTAENLTAISQGKTEKSGPGTFLFQPENPLPQISLAIGEYEKRSMTVDSVEYVLFSHPRHDYFVPYFSEIGDTLAALIREARQEFESEIDLSYPFPRLTLVETPIQYFAFERRLSSVNERHQPEQLLLPENGALLYATDFKRSQQFMERRNQERNRDVSPKEIQTYLFDRFAEELHGSGFRGRMGEMRFPISYSLIPQYYQFVTFFNSRNYPLLSTALESFLSGYFGEEESPFVRFFRGITDEEKANLLLREQSLADLLAEPEHFDQIKHVIRVKSNFLFKRLIGEMGEEGFKEFMFPFIEDNRFRSVNISLLVEELRTKFNINLLEWLDPWLNDVSLPGLFISNIQAFEVLDRNMTRYQVSFVLSNEKEVAGLVEVEFRGGDRRGGPGFGPPPVMEKRVITIGPRQAKEIYLLLDEQPRGMRINTVMAENLPQTFMQRLDDLELNEKAVPFDGEKVLPELPPFTLPGEYIVDNEDPGFSFDSGEKKSMIQKLLNLEKEQEEEYVPFRFYRPPSTWRKTTFDDFYGRYVHSACFVRSGDGSKTATWTANLESSGRYDIFAYNPQIRMRFGDRGRGRGGGENYVGELHFIVHHDDGAEEVILNAPEAEKGWNLLGTFYLSEGEAKVDITNESNERLVIADAVKWVKKEN